MIMNLKKEYITKKSVKEVLGRGFDDEGLITMDIDDINKLIRYYLEFSD